MSAKSTKGKKKKYQIVVNREWCKGCYLCLDACPKKVFEKDDGFNAKGYQPVRAAQPEECTGCRACTVICPDMVFELYELLETA
jgi:2-oxoglutarate ferredoxin oxidoreductase subunit delta